MLTLALLTTALLFGGSVLYAFGFAAFLFHALPADTARAAIRQAFPWFYLFVLLTAALAAALTIGGDVIATATLAAIAATTVFARQVLMPAINRATDAGNTTRFRRLHAASVAITLIHIACAGWILARLAT